MSDVLADSEGAKDFSQPQFLGCVQSITGRSIESVEDEILNALEVLEKLGSK